ncbi:hypothetical protein JQ600_35410 [Bradyrhizobium sp. AUGA SZCCT0176]|uniref:hypothetical protein n=1 Tax=Bradyrhizobium sp. AUGA SZCCT0176 TaxID=2807664 RepID=UPI001BA46993|nr:hypothetical protein [Bradyrhizobium sp. AUGA SZCCT0176]MBR1230185.1 hypothetical protein [Bradyrhizobium sp. AUGA SZCCT0176]
MTDQEIDDLKKRVEQLEKALWAVAFNKPTCCDERGRLAAAPALSHEDLSSINNGMALFGYKVRL